MTQHILEEHTLEDKQIMRRLGIVVGVFLIATAAMATIISLVM